MSGRGVSHGAARVAVGTCRGAADEVTAPDRQSVSLGSLSERHCVDSICVRMVSPLEEKGQEKSSFLPSGF